MLKPLPKIIEERIPDDLIVIKSDAQRLFNLYPLAESKKLAAQLKEEIGRDCFPIGTFISGDIVCWLGGESIGVVFHDDMELSVSGVTLSEFMERLFNLDVDLESYV